jgi:hypothetical protein
MVLIKGYAILCRLKGDLNFDEAAFEVFSPQISLIKEGNSFLITLSLNSNLQLDHLMNTWHNKFDFWFFYWPSALLIAFILRK